MSRRSTALKPYPGGQTRRQTEEHGDLNVYNRMYQFYNYHADKDILIDEMCRGLVLSLLRISGGSVQEYDEPLGWTAPYFQDHCSHHHAIVFHMKDQRRHSATFAQTLSSFSGADATGADKLLPEQYDADHKVSHTSVPTWVQLHHADGTMRSMAEVAAQLAACIKIWIEAQTFGGADDSEQAVRGLDLVPCRLQLLKRSVVSGMTSYEVVIDDREFDASKVDVAAYTTVTMQNVTPAMGDSLMTGDALSSDTINHVPLKGKMYTFAGPVPKVWDRHRADLQHLFKPDFFQKGRYLLPNSKLHDETMDDFRTFPRGRHIWSNCVGEDRITFQPGSTQKLKLEYRMKTSVRDFFHKFRNDDISSSKLGRCVCLALEPSIRRQHQGQPISVVLPKRIWKSAGREPPNDVDGTVVDTAVQYEPYQWAHVPKVDFNGDPVEPAQTIVMKRPRQVFRLNTSVTPSHQEPNPAVVEYAWVYPGAEFAGNVVWEQSGETPAGGGYIPLLWDNVTRDLVITHPELAQYVSKGDPIMFNVQINRLYTGSSLLKNHSRLGADKTGIKRKHVDKMYSNMGDVSFAHAEQYGDVFKDHDLQSAHQIGVAPLIQEGDAMNAAVTVNVAAETQAFTDALRTLDQDGDPSNGIQLDVVGSALSALADVIDTDGLQVHGAFTDTGLATDIADAIAEQELKTRVVDNVNVAVVNKQRDWLTIGGIAYSSVGIMGLLAKARGLGSAAAETMEAQISQGMSTFTVAAFLSAVALTALSDIADIAHFIYDVSSHKKVTVTGTVDIGNPGDVNVTGATAAEIATAIAGETLTVSGAVDIAIPEQEGTLLATEIADKLAERTLDVTGTVEVDNHPTSVEVSNHPTSIGVNNHPTYAGPTADDIADAIEGKTLTTKLAGNVAGTTTTVAVDGDFPTATAIAEAISDSNGNQWTIIGASNDKFTAMKLINGQENTVQRQYIQRQDLTTINAGATWDPIMMVGMKVYLHSNSNTFIESYDAAAPAPQTQIFTITGIDYNNDGYQGIDQNGRYETASYIRLIDPDLVAAYAESSPWFGPPSQESSTNTFIGMKVWRYSSIHFVQVLA